MVGKKKIFVAFPSFIGGKFTQKLTICRQRVLDAILMMLLALSFETDSQINIRIGWLFVAWGIAEMALELPCEYGRGGKS